MDTREIPVPQRVESDVTFDVAEITPQMALDILGPQADWPPIDYDLVALYEEAMTRKGWVENGQPIIIGNDGKLIDGFHRLLACSRAKVAIRTVIARGVAPDTLHTIEQHRRRTFANVLESRGVKHAGDIARALHKLFLIENGLLKIENPRPGWARLDKIVGQNPEIVEAAYIARSFERNSIQIGARVPFVFMALRSDMPAKGLLGNLDDQDPRLKIQNFLRSMRDRNVMMTTPPRMLEFTLQSLLDNVGTGGKSPRKVDNNLMLALSILAYNDKLRGVSADGPYSWRARIGNATLSASGQLIGDKEGIPLNCGLPVMIGYQGLRAGKIEEGVAKDRQMFDGPTAESLIEAAKSKTEISVASYLITPQVALAWLGEYNSGNRKIKDSHAARLARDIIAGNWMVNAQPICFHGNPFAGGPARLINGQHRLRACVLANMSIEVPIAINIPEAAFATYDEQPRKRKYRKEQDVSAGDERVMMSAAILQWREDQGYELTSRERPTVSEQLATLERHPAMREYASEVRRTHGDGAEARLDRIATASVMTYLLYRFTREDEAVAKRFFTGLRTGANMHASDPLLRIREAALQRRRGSERLDRYSSLEALLDGWALYREWVAKGAKAAPVPARIEALAVEGGDDDGDEEDVTQPVLSW